MKSTSDENLIADEDLNAQVDGLIDRLIALYSAPGELHLLTADARLLSAVATLVLRATASGAARVAASQQNKPLAAFNMALIAARCGGLMLNLIDEPTERLPLLQECGAAMIRASIEGAP